ncbi:unnamed protein product [Diatraea saccharalis]|uniref:Uncharacterized protein n=1 Tax=Diatraea saccharalis TaxID=40085 RepID=A0A9N9RCA8_9NEOP|nr:unnamed protein product [Diatraea saccharalis]
MTTSFEHSAMKSSFSLSSLGNAPAPPGGRCEQLERPYHSLTKKRKEPCREAWRRSWGSAASGGSAIDDLWPLLQHHYDYIMDNQIIDTCKEANGELLSHNSSVLQHGPRLLNPTSGFNRQWSLSQLIAEFTELCQWLTHVQEEIYSSPENLSSRKLRTSRMSELKSVEPRRVKFIEQASAILERIPEASAEVTWRMEHLNVKWEGLRLLLSPEQQNKDGEGSDTVAKTAEATAAADRVDSPCRSHTLTTVGSARVFRLKEVDGVSFTRTSFGESSVAGDCGFGGNSRTGTRLVSWSVLGKHVCSNRFKFSCL